ncbi:MAG: molybdate ABC transporter substrate-binding protein [Rhodospirillaceae bacterium TMED8]|nr:molybdate ABC transporter substrate-binding protein [Magnetovibrio sp.]OUT49642.1 MAG: molybdate ABC transporter substrate-binding protein [Rhodospirillaceae bacterium TMED8]
MWLPRVCVIVVVASIWWGASPSQAEVIHVYSAASLSDVFTKISRVGSTRGLPKCVGIHAASSALARQIIAGAPADIFISANSEWTTYVRNQGLTRGLPKVFTRNKLVLITPLQSDFKFDFGESVGLAPLLRNDWLTIADPNHVPAGRYARAALKKFGYWSAVKHRVVRVANVRAALALVSRAEALAGIVYASDVKKTTSVRVVSSISQNSHPDIQYIATKIGKISQPIVDEYFKFLLSSEVASILIEHGFEPLK